MQKGHNNLYTMRAKVWLYPGPAAWHFLTLRKKQSAEIKKKFGMMKRGWGSLSVQVTLGKTSWKTSIFPDKKSGAYLLPLKSDIRKKENLHSGDTVRFLLEILT